MLCEMASISPKQKLRALQKEPQRRVTMAMLNELNETWQTEAKEYIATCAQ